MTADYTPGKSKEVRVTSATGGEKGQKNIRLGGADPIAMLELGRVYGMGETKYARFNYLKGYAWSLSIDALKRHLLAYEAGQDYDECPQHPGQHGDDHDYDPKTCEGSGLLHTAHVSWHGLTLTSFLERNLGTDDRAPRAQAPEPPVERGVWRGQPDSAQFMCGHYVGEEPVFGEKPCGTSVHWSKVGGVAMTHWSPE